MRRALPYVAVSMLLAAALAYGGAIKTWTTNERLKAADLNSNFQHVHNNMIGGGHALLVNADVSASAAISHSKLATPALVPKAWARNSVLCNAVGNCTLSQSSQVTSVAWSVTGSNHYDVTLAYPPTTANFMAIVSIEGTSAELSVCAAGSYSAAAPHFKIWCQNQNAGVTTTNVAKTFSFVVYDTANY